MDQEQRTTTSVNFSLEEKRKLRIEAASQGLSVSAFIRQLFAAWLQFKSEQED